MSQYKTAGITYNTFPLGSSHNMENIEHSWTLMLDGFVQFSVQLVDSDVTTCMRLLVPLYTIKSDSIK